jgi:hypothetical protein
MKAYHAILRNQKNAGFVNGEITIPFIDETGHFLVGDDEVTKRALKEAHPEDIFYEGEEGYVEKVIPVQEDSVLYSTKLKIEIEALQKENKELKAEIAVLKATPKKADSTIGTKLPLETTEDTEKKVKK